MTPNEKFSDVDIAFPRWPGPVTIVSTVVGRGMYALGEALRERLADRVPVTHLAIEDLVAPDVAREDLERYKWISSRVPVLLHVVYRVPFIYHRKYWREKYFPRTDYDRIDRGLKLAPGSTVVCVSHRPAFWMSAFRRSHRADFQLWGLSGEYGDSLGWRYLFWDQFDGLLVPFEPAALSVKLPPAVSVIPVDLPARRAYAALSADPGDRNAVLVVCGYWGQGPLLQIAEQLLRSFPALRITLICGENESMRKSAQYRLGHQSSVRIEGAVPSLVPYLRECASVITKPGIATLIEGHAARRKIFLLPGMPVAEDHNRDYAMAHFNAESYSIPAFSRWYHAS